MKLRPLLPLFRYLAVCQNCDVNIQLSATLRPLPNSVVSNVHGVRERFLELGDEAANAESFNDDIADGPLAGAVFAPKVVREASSRRVLTTEWVDGERLDRTAATDDVPRLASLAMNTYMNMMLETGTLHCDPHRTHARGSNPGLALL